VSLNGRIQVRQGIHIPLVEAPWFKGLCGLVLLTFTWSTFGEAYAEAAQRRRDMVQHARDVAKNLRLPAEALLDPKGYAKEQARLAEQRRQAAVADMRRRLGPDPVKLALHEEKVSSIQSKRPNAKWEALGQLAETASRIATQKKPEAAALLGSASTLLASLPKPQDPRLTAKLASAKHQLASFKPSPSGRGEGEGKTASRTKKAPSPEAVLRAAKSLEAGRPEAIRVPVSKQRSLQAAPKHTPRQLPSEIHGSVDVEMKALYASVADTAYVPSYPLPLGEGQGEGKTTPVLVPAANVAAGARIDRSGPRVASASVFPMLEKLAADALPPPTPADLAATSDVLFTPEVQALAQQLGNNPLRIFDYVHDRFTSEVYYGSKKGSQGALLEQAGNDFDLSSLLIALLRVSGVPARYEYGTVNLTPAQVLDLTGFTDPIAAANALAFIGVPTTELYDPTSVNTLIAIQIERVWVRAYVPYSNYRGSGHSTEGQSIWVRLDPGMKRRVAPTAPSAAAGTPVNLRGLATFDPNAYLTTLNPQTPQQVFEAALLAAAKANNVCSTLEAGLPFRAPLADNFTLLPFEHPAMQVVSSLMVFSAVPRSFQFGVTFLIDGTSASMPLPQLYGQTIAFRYVGDSAADQQAIAAAGGIANLPAPYAVTIDPVVQVNGMNVLQGPGTQAGNPDTFEVDVMVPEVGPLALTHPIVSGGVYAVGLSPQILPASIVAQRQAALTQALASGALAEDIDEARAQVAIARYMAETDSSVVRLFGLQQYGGLKDVTEGLAGRKLDSTFAFGIPVAVSEGHYSIDIARESLTPFGLDGDSSLVTSLNVLAGYQGSTEEHRVWEETLNTPSASAVNTLQEASAQGIPLLTVTTSNQATQLALLSGYSDGTISDVEAALQMNASVVIPQHPVSFLQYPNEEAFISTNPDGTGIYEVSGTLRGGDDSGSSSAPSSGDSCPYCSGATTNPGSTLQFSTGEWRESYTDLTLPGLGIPIVFSRTYRSRSTRDTLLGFGWSHTYAMQLVANGDATLTYFTEDGQALTFTPTGSSTFAPPPGWYQTITADLAGYTMRFKNGLTYRFDLTGKLLFEEDTNGNTVTLAYDTFGRLMTVTDASGRLALTFGYDANNNLSGITDVAGRNVSFNHTGLDLTSATDVLGFTETYSYSALHQMQTHTDKNGNTWTNLFNADGWYIGTVDPAGNASQVAYDPLGQTAAFTDRTGATTTYQWNAAGNPVSIENAQGDVHAMTWDSSLNKLSDTDGRNDTWTFSYDGQGNQITRTDPLSNTTTMTYDPTFNHLLTVNTPGIGLTTTNTYDGKGNLQTSTDGTGNTTTYGYFANGLPQTVTQPGSAATTLSYFADGSVQTMTDPTSRTTTLGYDGAGHLTAITDNAGNHRTLVPDARGQVTSMTDALGNSSSFTYDAVGNRKTAKDPAGNTTSFGYDMLNRQTSATDALGNTSTTAYDAEGRVTARVDAKGNRTSFAYDALGRLIETTTPDGSVTSYGFCADLGGCSGGSCGGVGGSGQACEIVDPLGNVTSVAYDPLGRQSTRTDPLGNTTSQTYDPAGRTVSRTDPNQQTTLFTFDQASRLHSVDDPESYTTTYGYDGRGNRTSVQDANGHVTSFTYDSANRLLTETNPLRQTTSYTYDAAGNRQTKMDGNGNVTSYSYDPNRRLTTVTFADGSAYQFNYDSRGNRTLEQSPSHERDLVFDSLNRVQTVTDVTLQKVLGYTYDPNGNRATFTVTDSTGTSPPLTTSYQFDSQNRLNQVTDPDGAATQLVYDAAGNRKGLTFGNGVAASYGYDSAERLTSISYVAPGGSVLEGFAYQLDPAGNRRLKIFADGTFEQYAYDTDNRLTQANYPSGLEVDYTLDGVGNRQVVTERVNGSQTFTDIYSQPTAFNQISEVLHAVANGPETTTDFTYDNNGNLVSQAATPRGGTSATTTYTFDLENRLRQVNLPTGLIDTYEYDANGLRTRKVDSSGDSRFLLDGPSIVADYDTASGSQTAFYVQNPQRIDEILSSTVSVSGTPTKVYPLTDALGSIYELTDPNGNAVSNFSFDAYGARMQTSGTLALRYGFTGREHEFDSAVGYYRDRFLAFATGTWTQADRLLMVDGPNLYGYGLQNPALNTDPNGQFALFIGILFFLGAVLGLDNDQQGIEAPGTIFFASGVGLGTYTLLASAGAASALACAAPAANQMQEVFDDVLVGEGSGQVQIQYSISQVENTIQLQIYKLYSPSGTGLDAFISFFRGQLEEAATAGAQQVQIVARLVGNPDVTAFLQRFSFQGQQFVQTPNGYILTINLGGG
jgi:RHS repeat-associated protein